MIPLSPDARAILDLYVANSVHIGAAAEKMAAEIAGLIERLEDADRQIAAAQDLVSRGYVRARPR